MGVEEIRQNNPREALVEEGKQIIAQLDLIDRKILELQNERSGFEKRLKDILEATQN